MGSGGIVRHCQILSDIVRHCQTSWSPGTLSDIVELRSIARHCQTLSDIVRHCQTPWSWEHCQTFSDIVRHCQTPWSQEHCQTLSDIVRHRGARCYRQEHFPIGSCLEMLLYPRSPVRHCRTPWSLGASSDIRSPHPPGSWALCVQYLRGSSK